MSETIVCKPTPWFLLRAVAMVLMFGVFAVMFYQDGSVGYREKNLSYYSWKGIEAAAADFTAKQEEMTPSAWRDYAAGQVFPLPEDRGILPEGTPEEIPWPAMLGDYETMKAGLANPRSNLFEPYMEEAGLKKSPPEHEYDAGKIFEQWVVFWICLALTIAALFLLLRTLGRKMVLDGDDFLPAGGGAYRIDELVRLDLRKWENKGLAFAWAKRDGEEQRIRIDGLTYGGFKEEQGAPAERLMQGIKARFSGEVIDYESAAEEGSEAEAADA